MARVFKTPKGTELQIMSLKGKDYMTVQQRLIWFTEENPRYDITTDFVRLTDEDAVAKCTISILEDTPQGVRVIRKVTDYKTENASSFPDFVEKAATGACGRCLALLSYGTQFATADLDEGDRIVDSPVVPKEKTSSTKTAISVSAPETKTAAEVSSGPAPGVVPAIPAEKKPNKFLRTGGGL